MRRPPCAGGGFCENGRCYGKPEQKAIPGGGSDCTGRCPGVVVAVRAGREAAAAVCGSADGGWEQQQRDPGVPLGSGDGNTAVGGAGGGERESHVSGGRSGRAVSLRGE